MCRMFEDHERRKPQCGNPGSDRSLEILVNHHASEPVQDQGEEERWRGGKDRDRESRLRVTQFEDLQRQLRFEYTLVPPQDVMHLN